MINPKLSPQVLGAKTSVLQDKRPTNATYGYDFRETSAASHDVVVEKVKKIDFGDSKDFTGVHCIPVRSPAIAFALLSYRSNLGCLPCILLPNATFCGICSGYSTGGIALEAQQFCLVQVPIYA